MVFSGLPFLFFFLAAVLLIDRILPKRFKNFFLLIANLFFYAYGEPVYVLLMMGSIIVNYILGMAIEKSKGTFAKRTWLIGGVVINLAALGVFKYLGFTFDLLRHIPIFSSLPEASIVLPIGISFYTFQAMSYVIDVYRGDCKAAKSFVNFAAYISLFPQLIAGPIVRYRDVYAQIEDRTESMAAFASGVRLFTIGLAKKVLLANQLGILWTTVSQKGSSAGTAALWLGLAAYILQLYFDFCGYSEMAQGLGKMLGFDFMANFNYPYISESVTEFWRRWHISLSSWFRDYVYIPLGGNRRGKARQCFNIMVVWSLTGIWHGAGLNFLVWGFFYGVVLILEKLFLGNVLKKLPKAVRHIYTMLIVMISFLFFASESFGAAADYLSGMFTLSASELSLIVPWLPTVAVGAVCSTPLGASLWRKHENKPFMVYLEAALCLGALLLCTAQLVSDSYNPFLYFRF